MARYDQNFRFKNVNTGQYLSCARNKNDAHTTFSTQLEPGPSTLFALVPVDPLPDEEQSAEIPYENYTCLHHIATDTYLHAKTDARGKLHFSRSQSSRNPGVNSKDSTMLTAGDATQCEGLRDRHAEDAFAVQLVSEEEVEHLHYTKSQISYLRKHVIKLQSGDRADFTRSQLNAKTDLRAMMTKKAILVLMDLIRSCSISSDQNPYTREGMDEHCVKPHFF